MRTRLLLTAALALGLLPSATVVPASAKEFRPGDLKLCNDQRCIVILDRCIVILDRSLLGGLSKFYFGAPAPAARKPRIGSPYLQISSSDGHVTGIVGAARLDRFRSGGMGRFSSDAWYRVPASVARGLRALAAGMKPLIATSSTIGRTRYG